MRQSFAQITNIVYSACLKEKPLQSEETGIVIVHVHVIQDNNKYYPLGTISCTFVYYLTFKYLSFPS